jgi:hypothetical protein
MPALGSHLSSARQIAERLSHRDVDLDRGAFYLGATAPDIRIITRGEREDTHFFTLDDLAAQDSIARMLATHPRLANVAELDAVTRAFMAGYLTHLILDEHYIERMYREYFGVASALKGDQRADLLDRVLQYEMERREREQAEGMTAIREAIDASKGLADVEFIDADKLAEWREVAADMASHPPTWDRFARVARNHVRGQGEGAEAELMASVPELLREVLGHVSEERVRRFNEESIDEAVRRVREYLS